MLFHAKGCGELLCTETVRQAVLEAGLRGFHFEDVEHLQR